MPLISAFFDPPLSLIAAFTGELIQTQTCTRLVYGTGTPKEQIWRSYGATSPPCRPMDRTGNVADLTCQQHPPPSLLLALLTQLCLSPSFYSALCGGHTDTRASLLKPTPGARKLLGIQGFAAAEAGQDFSAQDGLHMGTEIYIPFYSCLY